LLQPAGRAIGLALTVLAVHALVAPSPLAVAAASVVKADIATMLWIAGPAAIVAAAVGWMLFARDDRAPGLLSIGWLAVPLRLGLLAPCLAAATVKTMQGNSLSAVLRASGMIEPMLPALGLDSATGRALAAASVGAGSIAICHVNDPFFWIAADMAGLTPARALRLVSLGSLAVAVAALGVVAALATVL